MSGLIGNHGETAQNHVMAALSKGLEKLLSGQSMKAKDVKETPASQEFATAIPAMVCGGQILFTSSNINESLS